MTSNVAVEPLRDPSDARKMDAMMQSFASVDDVPERAFFAKEYIARYKKHITELIKRMEHLVEEAENFETESEAYMEWNGKQLAGLTRDTVWQNICALQDCDLILNDTIDLFKQKVRVCACVCALSFVGVVNRDCVCVVCGQYADHGYRTNAEANNAAVLYDTCVRVCAGEHRHRSVQPGTVQHGPYGVEFVPAAEHDQLRVQLRQP